MDGAAIYGTDNGCNAKTTGMGVRPSYCAGTVNCTLRLSITRVVVPVLNGREHGATVVVVTGFATWCVDEEQAVAASNTTSNNRRITEAR
jgi:hypothetical protein